MSQDALDADMTTSAVYSSQEKPLIKPGIPVRQFARKQYWLVETSPDTTITIQALNVNKLPTGKKQPITEMELIANYTPEPEVHSQTVFQMEAVEKTLDRADSCRKKGEGFSAEFEYQNVLTLDEDNIRANFGAGINFLKQGEVGKADSVFRRLVQLEGAFEERHKHLFNDFGICMRKNKMYKQSIAFYKRALKLTKEDENLHINIARPLFQQGLLAATIEHLFEALRLAPGNMTAIRFLAWMERGGYVPRNFERRVTLYLNKYPIPDDLPPVCLSSGQRASGPYQDFSLPEALDEKLSDEVEKPIVANKPANEPTAEERARQQEEATRTLQDALQKYASATGLKDLALPEGLSKLLLAAGSTTTSS